MNKLWLLSRPINDLDEVRAAVVTAPNEGAAYAYLMTKLKAEPVSDDDVIGEIAPFEDWKIREVGLLAPGIVLADTVWG